MRGFAWIAVPVLLVSSFASVGAQTPAAAARSTKRSKPAPAKGEPKPVLLADLDLESDYAEALKKVDEGVQLATAKKKKEAKAAFDNAIKQLQAINAKVEGLAKTAANQSAKLDKDAEAKTKQIATVTDAAAKREAIVASNQARELALQQRLVAGHLAGSSKRQKDAIKEMTTAAKDGVVNNIRSASAAFSFELHRVIMTLNPPTPAPASPSPPNAALQPPA